jgi:hypothetical protein
MTLRSVGDVIAMRPALANEAAKIHAEWEPDAGPDGDPVVGFGGICQDVAEAMANVLAAADVEAACVSASCGEQHVFVIAALLEGVFVIDVPPSLYETGSGYRWTKRIDTVIEPEDVLIQKISDDPETFEHHLD